MNTRIMQVLEISHLDKYGKVLYQNSNLNNIIHTEGEEFILKILFGGASIPASYYLGLDSRSSLTRSDSISQISSFEPSSSGYVRQSVNTSSFAFVTNSLGDYQANSPVVIFRAVGGSWGPVKNIFLTTQPNNTNAYLISSVPLGANLTLQDQEMVSMRIGIALRNG